jgi:hypothetical protein
MLVLNGSEVVRQFQTITGQPLISHHMPAWDLARRNSKPVAGVAYTGTITAIGDITLARPVLVAGYNHDLQSSFGVSTAIRTAISSWIATQHQPRTPTATPNLWHRPPFPLLTDLRGTGDSSRRVARSWLPEAIRSAGHRAGSLTWTPSRSLR